MSKDSKLVKNNERLPVASKKEVADFLGKLATLPKRGGEARLIFALDATASRQPTWDMATQLQAEMFQVAQSLGGLQVQLCYFRGIGDFFHSAWHSSSDELLQKMLGIQCQAGATQLGRLLSHAMRENERTKIKGVVFVGDAMEEMPDRLNQLAGKLGLLNVPLFMFQEHGDPVARRAFTDLSRLSGGAYSQFDASSAAQLRELLQAVAVYAAGGLKALQDYSKSSGEAVKLLEQQIKS
jgi:hypothetical protein